MVGIRSPKHFLRLVKAYREDLQVWHSFLESFNGRALWMSDPVSNFDLELTDAGGESGFEEFFQGSFAGPWPQS